MRGGAKNKTRSIPRGNLHSCYVQTSLEVTKTTGLKQVKIRFLISSQHHELVEGAPCVSPRHGCRHGFQINGETAELMLFLLDDEFLTIWYFRRSDKGQQDLFEGLRGIIE